MAVDGLDKVADEKAKKLAPPIFGEKSNVSVMTSRGWAKEIGRKHVMVYFHADWSCSSSATPLLPQVQALQAVLSSTTLTAVLTPAVLRVSCDCISAY
jgi:hypothetical protein